MKQNNKKIIYYSFFTNTFIEKGSTDRRMCIDNLDHFILRKVDLVRGLVSKKKIRYVDKHRKKKLDTSINNIVSI